MTKARQRERNRQQAEMFPLVELKRPVRLKTMTPAEIRHQQGLQRRMIKLEDMRLAVKFGEKDEYSNWEFEAIWEELRLAGLDTDDENWDLDAIEALFKKLNKADAAR
jgi:hypothetical protein